MKNYVYIVYIVYKINKWLFLNFSFLEIALFGILPFNNYCRSCNDKINYLVRLLRTYFNILSIKSEFIN